MQTVTIERAGAGWAIAIVGGIRFVARFDATLRRWRVQTDAGEQLSVGAKLHSIGKLFGAPRAQVEGAPVVELAPALVISGQAVLRQVRRMLESMQEFGFEPGGYWWASVGRDEFESGFVPRHGGDPIYHTIGQVAGEFMTRAETIEALVAVVDGRRPNLPPRMQKVPAAIQLVAEALAAGRGVVETDGVSVRVEGPTLPADWDQVSAVIEEPAWPATWDEVSA